MLLKIVFLCLIALLGISIIFSVKQKRLIKGYVLTAVILLVMNILCFLLNGTRAVKDAKYLLTAYYVLHAWIYFGELLVVNALGRHKRYIGYSVAVIVLCMWQTLIFVGNLFGTGAMIFARHIFWGENWWIVESSKHASMWLGIRTYQGWTILNMLILFVVMLVRFFHSSKIFKGRLNVLGFMHISLIAVEIMTSIRPMPVWIMTIYINILTLTTAYYIFVYPDRRLREWSLMGFANDMNDAFVLYNEFDELIHVNDVVKSTKSGKSSPGYYTFDLDHLVCLKTGDVFEVVFRITVDGDAGVPISEAISLNQETYGENTSFISYDGKAWADFYDLSWSYPDHTYASQVACIKAFTLFDRIDSEVNIKVIYNKLGNLSTIVAYVYDEWGNPISDRNVTFDVDGNPYQSTISRGIAVLNYSLSADSHNISVTFNDSDYNPSNCSIQFIKPSNIEVTLTIDDIEFRDDLLAYISIHDSNGIIIMDNVSLKINNTVYNLTVYEDKYYKLPFNLDYGLYEAEISGNDFDTRKVNFTVFKSGADLNIDFEVDYNDASITISLSNKLNETAIVNIFGENITVSLENGQATLNYNDLPCGSYDVSVYLSQNYQNNFISDTFLIDYRNTTLTVFNMTTYYYSGGELRITLKDSNGNPVSNKPVKITVGGITATRNTHSDGIAVYEVYLENGIHDVNVEFAGDSYYVSSEASARITVLTSIILSSDLTKTYGSHYTFKLLDTDGNPLWDYEISVKFDGKSELIESDSNGVFSLKINKKAGNYNLAIVNPINNEKISKTVKVVSRITENKAVTMYYGAGKSYTVKVLDDNGNVAKRVAITFKIGGKTYTKTTNDKGYASLKINLNPNTYTITATYKGFSVSNKIVIKPTLILAAKTVKKSKTFKYNVKLLDKNGKILKNKKITVKFRGKTYAAKTSSKGIATFNVKALSKTGKYTLTAIYGSAKISKTITIKK